MIPHILLDCFGAILIVAYLFLLVFLAEKLINFIAPFWEFVVQKLCDLVMGSRKE